MGKQDAIIADVPAKVPLGNTPLGIWGSFRAGQRNVLELIPEIATRAPILSGTTGKRWHMLMDPDGLKQVLRDKVEDYPKSMVTKLILGSAIGNSMFVAEGAEWLWQRRTAAPVFSHRNIAALAPVMTAAAERAAARFAAAADSPANRGHAIDAFDEMVTATFEVISDVTLSGGEGFDRSAVHKAIEDFIGQSAKISVLDIMGAPAWVPRPGRMFAASTMRQMKQDRRHRHSGPQRAWPLNNPRPAWTC